MVPGTSMNLPTILECTFLRKDRFSPLYCSASPTLSSLPHPFDYPCSNQRPDIPLSFAWFSEDYMFSLLARIKEMFLHRFRLLGARS